MTNIYNNGKIYKLINSDNTLCYIGSTVKTLEQRKSKHANAYKSWKAGGHNYVTSFKVIEDDIDGLNIFLLENVSCNSKDELTSRERYYIDTIQCVNKYMPNRTKQEYYKDNKEIIQKYYNDNKDKLLKKHKCDCGGQYTHTHKSKHFKTKKHKLFLHFKGS